MLFIVSYRKLITPSTLITGEWLW